MISVLCRNWWAVALRGALAILFGLATILWPRITLVVLIFWFGAYVLLDGIFASIFAIRTRGRETHWWLFLIEGVVEIAVAVITFVWPGITALALLYLIAAWAILTGILRIFIAIRLRREITGEWALALGGAVSLILGLLIAAFPAAGALAVVWLIGAFALLLGTLLLVLAFQLRGWQRRLAGT